MSSRGWILYPVLVALLIAAIPPGYGALLERAHEEDLVSEDNYALAHKIRWFLEQPGRLLLSPTSYDGALISSHVPFWGGLLALILANWLGWFLLLFLLLICIRKTLVGRLQTGWGKTSEP